MLLPLLDAYAVLLLAQFRQAPTSAKGEAACFVPAQCTPLGRLGA